MTMRTLGRARALLNLAPVAALVATTAPAPAAAPATATATTRAPASAYLPNPMEDAQNDRLAAQLKAALARQSAANRQGTTKSLGAQATAMTIYYDGSGAPSFASQIQQSAQIWNSSVTAVKLAPAGLGQRASFSYRQSSSGQGSYAQTDGHGSGTIVIDTQQARQYDPLRIVAHETGHVLGLPDNYSGPCSELMSGGGAGPTCTNPYPNATERAEVDAAWSYGYAEVGAWATAAFRDGR